MRRILRQFSCAFLRSRLRHDFPRRGALLRWCPGFAAHLEDREFGSPVGTARAQFAGVGEEPAAFDREAEFSRQRLEIMHRHMMDILRRLSLIHI